MLDQQLFALINGLPHNEFTDYVALSIHLATYRGLIYYPILLYLLLAKDLKMKTLGKLGAIAGLATYLINDLVVKNLIGRDRPIENLTDFVFVSNAPASYSFPSGQSAVAFSLAAMLWLFYPKRWFSYAMFACAAIIGLDRIYLGHHYPSDVVAGAVIGVVVSILVLKIKNKLVKGK